MKTTIWLKSQSKKKLEYPDCWPKIYHDGMQNYDLTIKDIEGNNIASYTIESISRMEFRP